MNVASPSDGLSLRAAAALAGVDSTALWWDCLGLGEPVRQDEIAAALADDPAVDGRVASMVALAIDERLLDLGIEPLLAQPRTSDPLMRLHASVGRAAVCARAETLCEIAAGLSARARAAQAAAAETCATSKALRDGTSQPDT